MSLYDNVDTNIQFINISSQDLTLLEWKPPRSFKSFVLDLNIVKAYATDNIFFHIDKGNMRIVHIRKGNIIYSIGSNNNVQFQLLEAILNKINEEFNEIYDINVIFSYGNVTPNMFKAFKPRIDNILLNIKELNLTIKVDVYCRVCEKLIPVLIKRRTIETAESFPVPIVYIHNGHALLLYIDAKYAVRGQELVDITG